MHYINKRLNFELLTLVLDFLLKAGKKEKTEREIFFAEPFGAVIIEILEDI